MDRKDEQGLIQIVVVVIVVVVLGLYLYFNVYLKKDVSVPPGQCTCDDIDDINNRLAEAKAAENAINNQSIPDQQADDQKAGQPAMYTEPLYEKGAARLQDAINQDPNRNPKARKGTGKTGLNCDTHPTAPTPCLRAAIQVHENVHSTECQKFKGPGDDWKQAKTMVNYWREDASAYAAEQQYLTNELNRLTNDPKCKPVTIETYEGARKREQQERLAGSRRRFTNYVTSIN